MSTEIRKGVIRIISNYTRLLLTLTLGIAAVPLTLGWLGEESFGIISLLGANIGLAAIFSQIITMSLVRELGHAYHADDETFRKNFAVICTVSLVCAVLSLLSFGLVFLLVPVFRISEDFIAPARWFVFGQGVFTSIRVLLSPVLNMYLVKEKFVGYNIWFVGVRATNIIAVLILGYAFVIDDPHRGLAALGILWSTLAIAGVLIAALFLIRLDPRLMPRFERGDHQARKQVLSTFSWNTGVQVAMNIHEQVPPLLLNLFFGTLINAAWGLGFRFVAYIRMVTTGVQFGSDAVSARIASSDDSERSRRQLQQLINIQTKLTTMVALPAAAGVFLYSWPIFHLWVGHSLKNYEAVMPPAVYMARILTIALAARAISDTWLLILYGAGFVRAYAPWVLAGGLFAPVASVALMFIVPEPWKLYVPAAVFAFVLLTVHQLGLPIIVGRCLNLNPLKLFFGVFRPLLATIVAAGCALLLLYLAGHLDDLGLTNTINRERATEMNARVILASIALFGFVYAVVSYVFVLNKGDRERMSSMLKRKTVSEPNDSDSL